MTKVKDYKICDRCLKKKRRGGYIFIGHNTFCKVCAEIYRLFERPNGYLFTAKNKQKGNK